MNYGIISLLDWGSSYNGEHYNSRCILYDGGIRESFEVYYKLKASHARKLNKKEGYRSYMVGDESKRFFSRNEAIKESVAQLLGKCSDISIIIIGNSRDGLLNPSEVVYCIDEGLRIQMNELYRRLEEYYEISDNPWSVDSDSVDSIYSEWDRLVHELG